MAIYHFHIKVHSRRRYTGLSTHALAAYRSGSVQTSSILRTAAYRSGGVLKDATAGQTHDFSRKRGVEWTGIMAPSYAPSWVYDRQKLWSAVEASETRINSRLAREAEVTLPRELTLEQNKSLVRGFVEREFVGRGMVADIAIHCVKAKDGLEQPHAHIMATTRAISLRGFGEKRRDWNKVELLKGWRVAWQEACNKALEDAGEAVRVDHRTLEAQGSPKLPNVTMGKAEHASDDYEFVRAKKAKAEDVRAYNSTLDIGGMVVRAVTSYMQGGVIGLAEAALGQVLHAGLLPGASTSGLMSIPRTVVRMVDGMLHGRPTQ